MKNLKASKIHFPLYTSAFSLFEVMLAFIILALLLQYMIPLRQTEKLNGINIHNRNEIINYTELLLHKIKSMDRDDSKLSVGQHDLSELNPVNGLSPEGEYEVRLDTGNDVKIIQIQMKMFNSTQTFNLYR